MQYELYEHKLKEDKEYSAVQLSDILKWIDKPFRALNDTEKEKDRVWFCDFKPRKKYIYNGKWRMIKKKRELSQLEKTNFLNVYDKTKHEFRKINFQTLSFLKIGRCRFRVDQVKDIETYPRVTLKRLP